MCTEFVLFEGVGGGTPYVVKQVSNNNKKESPEYLPELYHRVPPAPLSRTPMIIAT